MTIKDSVAVLDARSGAALPQRRGEAVGAEIPVTVHASRSTQDLGKNLPPVHEETRTVIVLPQGAVVRLTSTLTPGETVVLTNRVTGADVLCRVGNVKTQPGIQHYVDLEFTQRAPGFWGDSVAAQDSAVLEAPAVAPTPSVPPSVTLKPPAPVAQPPVIATPAPIANLHQAAKSLKPTPLAESVSAAWPGPQTNEAHSIRPVVRPATASRASADAGPEVRTPRMLAADPLGAGIAPGASLGSKKGILLVAASVVLVVGAAIGGYWFHGQAPKVPEAPLSQQQVVSVPQTEAAPPVLPQVDPLVEPTAVSLNSTPLPAAGADIVIQSRNESVPPVERPVTRNQPSPASVARAPQPAVRRSSVAIGKLQAPVQRTLPSASAFGEAPPTIVGAPVDLGVTGASSTLLASTGSDAAPPPPSSRPAVGGQLLPPRLISSTAPAYPADARAQRVQGVVILDALVDETGKVVETTVIAGPAPLQLAAKAALLNWKYEPARLNGAPIAVHTKVNLRFNLN